jgi:PAS domain S-box-containing protein
MQRKNRVDNRRDSGPAQETEIDVRYITECQRAQEKLRESEARFRELAENIDEVFWLADADLQSIACVSPAYERVWGRSCESLREEPRSFLDAIHPQDRPRVLEALKARTNVPYELEYRIIRPDGSVRWISDRSFPIRSQAGNIYRFGGIACDITRRKQAEERLATHQAQLEEAQALARLGSWCWDIPSGALNWSDELYRRFGRKPKEFGPTHEAFLELLHPEDRAPIEAAIEGALSAKRPYDCEVRIVRPDGSLRVLHTRGRVIFDQGGKPLRMTGAAQDITEIKQLEEEVLAVSEREQRRIGQDLHDDLCQRLAGIQLMGDVLQRDLLAKAKPEAEQAAMIAVRIRDAIAHTRMLARGLSPVALDSNGLMAALQELAENSGKLFQISCEFRFDGRVAVDNDAVATHLYRIAQEAVTNAVKHGRAKKVVIRLAESEDKCILTITDDGLGLPETPAKNQGTGLQIMKYRAATIGASLKVCRAGGRGTCVSCSFCKPPRPKEE